MKIRTDFVTNSSSSSFVAFTIQNKELAEICKKYRLPVDVDDDLVSAEWDTSEACDSFHIEDDDVIRWFSYLLDTDYYEIQYCDGDVRGADAEICRFMGRLRAATESYDISVCNIETEDYGSRYTYKQMDDDVISTVIVDESNWSDIDDENSLWQILLSDGPEYVADCAVDNGLCIKTKNNYSLNGDDLSYYCKSYYGIDLVGTGKEGRAPNHEYMKAGDTVELVREPCNPYDSNAIIVKGKGRELGHIPAETAAEIAWLLDSGMFVVTNATVSSSTPLSQRSKQAKNPMMTISFKVDICDNAGAYKNSNNTAPVTPDDIAKELLNAGYRERKLEAIKILMERTGLSLKDAKNVIDRVFASAGHDTYTPASTEKSGECYVSTSTEFSLSDQNNDSTYESVSDDKDFSMFDANRLAEILESVLELCDNLDNSGVAGVAALTKGSDTSRDTLRVELCRFLIYIGKAKGYFSDGEVALMNIVYGAEFTASQYLQISSTMSDPNPNSSLILMGFLYGDMAINHQNGTRSTQVSDVLIDVYEAFGGVMAKFSENHIANTRNTEYISGMRNYVMERL